MDFPPWLEVAKIAFRQNASVPENLASALERCVNLRQLDLAWASTADQPAVFFRQLSERPRLVGAIQNMGVSANAVPAALMQHRNLRPKKLILGWNSGDNGIPSWWTVRPPIASDSVELRNAPTSVLAAAVPQTAKLVLDRCEYRIQEQALPRVENELRRVVGTIIVRYSPLDLTTPEAQMWRRLARTE
ncbi:hypothetical protein DFJ74DRAFT_703228 [Hyaloraphidium curvatum]|nr:hypothetical protein DFJ74DRAFT_703228 [Hyaloraphidium curvatum]